MIRAARSGRPNLLLFFNQKTREKTMIFNELSLLLYVFYIHPIWNHIRSIIYITVLL